MELLGNISIIIYRQGTRICGPAFTIQWGPSTHSGPKVDNPVDAIPKGSVVVIKVPPQLPNAVWGGLMSARASFLGAKGVVIEGNARDLTESQEMVCRLCANNRDFLCFPQEHLL